MEWSGLFRIYWNTDRDKPKVWSIDNGNPMHELNVVAYEVSVPVESCFNMSAEWPYPKGWMQGKGYVQIDEIGVARVTAQKPCVFPVCHCKPASREILHGVLPR